MQAIVFPRYGEPEVLRQEDIPRPVPGEAEVLVRVRAAAANPMDHHLMSGFWLMRPMTGLLKPRNPRPGADLSGEVEAVGRNVTRFRPGDAVFGVARGAFAEYVCAAEDKLALKPAGMSWEQAAAIPVAGCTALVGLREKGRLKPEQKVLITGASGGVGSFAVQIAKALGAEVTAVCRTSSIEMVQSLGADRVIDYTREDFTRSAERFDLVFDTVGSRPLWACRRVMTRTGVFLPVGARAGGRLLGPIPHMLGLLVSRPFISQRVLFFMGRVTTEDLTALARMFEANQVIPMVDRCYPLHETAQAMRYLEDGHPRGKVVVRLP